MTATVTSTVPGALAALRAHFTVVAATSAVPDVASYLGQLVGPGKPANNFIMVGDFNTGKVLSRYRMTVPVFPAVAAKEEAYGIPCTVRAWAGASTPTAFTNRIADALALYDAALAALANDPNGGGALTIAGFWSVSDADIADNGPMGGQGFGVLLKFTVFVEGAYLTT